MSAAGFDMAGLQVGHKVVSRNGAERTVVAIVPEALQPIAVYDRNKREIELFSADGSYLVSSSESSYDLVSHHP